MDKSLKQIEAECVHWQAVSFGLIRVGEAAQAVESIARLAGWDETAEAALTFLYAIADCLEHRVIPAVDRHHEEHKAAQLETSRLEAGYL